YSTVGHRAVAMHADLALAVDRVPVGVAAHDPSVRGTRRVTDHTGASAAVDAGHGCPAALATRSIHPVGAIPPHPGSAVRAGAHPFDAPAARTTDGDT